MAGTLARRGFLRLGAGMAGAAGLAAVLGACSSEEGERGLVMLSTQLRPAAEAQALRDGVLADFDRPVSFVPLDGGPFNDLPAPSRPAPTWTGPAGSIRRAAPASAVASRPRGTGR